MFFSPTYLVVAEECWKSPPKLSLRRQFRTVQIALVERLKGFSRFDLYVYICCFFLNLSPTLIDLPHTGVKGLFLGQQPPNKCFVPPACRSSPPHHRSSADRGRASAIVQPRTTGFTQLLKSSAIIRVRNHSSTLLSYFKNCLANKPLTSVHQSVSK